MAIKSDVRESRAPAGLVKTLRSGIGRVSEEVIEEIQNRIPEYARREDELYIKVLRTAVEQAIEGFLDRVESPDAAWDPEPFRMVGKGEAAEGRNLEPLQTALRLGARVGWRRLTEIADPLGLSPQCLYDLGETIFVYLDQLADEVRGRRAGDLHRRIGARTQRALGREVHEPVVAGAAAQPSRIAPARALDHDLLDEPEAGLVAEARRALHHGAEATHALDGHLVRHGVGKVGGLGPGTGRVDEREGVVVAGLGGDLEGGVEVGVGLAGEAHDDVGGDGEAVDPRPGRGQAFEVALGGVAPVHGGEDAVAAGLQRQVQVLADAVDVRHGPDRLGSEVLGVGARVADPADARHPADGAQEVGEQRAGPAGAVLRPRRAGEEGGVRHAVGGADG